MTQVQGIHHVTAIAGDPRQNLEFYRGVLGLKLVKHTVNFDDPSTLHLYYGDGLGRPGTLLTFFSWPNGGSGLRGVHQVGVLTLSVPLAALGYWMQRLIEKGIRFEGPTPKGDAQVLAFQDPDGIGLELAATPHAPDAAPWEGAPVPGEHAVRGIHSVQLWVLEGQATLTLLERLGYRQVSKEGNTTRLAPPAGDGLVEVRETGQFLAGREGVGTIHHVAFRATDDDAQQTLRAVLTEQGLAPTPTRDRYYFRSVYFREPGGVLLEVATDMPGFTVDESPEELGTALKLPPQFESRRAELESVLPPQAALDESRRT